MNPVDFAKLSGSGNDFICIDNRDGRFDAMLDDGPRVGRFAQAVLARGMGLGGDGLIFACANEAPDFADLAARHFEPDGSEAELCGNGVACMTRWALDGGWAGGDELRILASAGVVRGKRIEGGYIRACIPLPEDIRRDIEVDAGGKRWSCDFCITGVPHVVTYVDDIEKLHIDLYGPAIRHHPLFRPRGVNANFVQVLGEGEIALRTWEFGVEGETLSCGTGSAAAAILTTLRMGWNDAIVRGDKPVEVRSRGGDVLRVYFAVEGAGHGRDAMRWGGLHVTDLCIETIVRFIAAGRLHPDLVARATAQEAAVVQHRSE